MSNYEKKGVGTSRYLPGPWHDSPNKSCAAHAPATYT